MSTKIEPKKKTIASTMSNVSRFTMKTSMMFSKYPNENRPTKNVAKRHCLTIRVSFNKSVIFNANMKERTNIPKPIKHAIALMIWMMNKILVSPILTFTSCRLTYVPVVGHIFI